jgi:hypothetical protein
MKNVNHKIIAKGQTISKFRFPKQGESHYTKTTFQNQVPFDKMKTVSHFSQT